VFYGFTALYYWHSFDVNSYLLSVKNVNSGSIAGVNICDEIYIKQYLYCTPTVAQMLTRAQTKTLPTYTSIHARTLARVLERTRTNETHARTLVRVLERTQTHPHTCALVLTIMQSPTMHRSAKLQTPPNAVDLLWSCRGLWWGLSFVFSRSDCHLTI